jgi:protein involved in polysaccharide export with SLBB domain
MRFCSGSAKLVKLLTVLWLLAACGPLVKNPTPLDSPEVQPPAEQPYKIQLGDSLDIKFFYNVELNEQVVVRPDGFISLQLIHDVKAAGLTPGELTDALLERYANLLAQPEVAVIVRSFTANRVFVDGEVVTPGAHEVVGPMTLRQSVALAGGLKDTAKTNEIIVIRKWNKEKPIILTVNYKKINNGTELEQDIPLVSSDIVYVPKSHIANVDIWVDQYVRRMLPLSLPTVPITGF